MDRLPVFPVPVPERGGGGKSQLERDLLLLVTVFQRGAGVILPDEVYEIPDRAPGLFAEAAAEVEAAETGNFLQMFQRTVPAVVGADVRLHGRDPRTGGQNVRRIGELIRHFVQNEIHGGAHQRHHRRIVRRFERGEAVPSLGRRFSDAVGHEQIADILENDPSGGTHGQDVHLQTVGEEMPPMMLSPHIPQNPHAGHINPPQNNSSRGWQSVLSCSDR